MFCEILSSVFTRVILNFPSVSAEKIVFLYISCLHGFSSMFCVKIPIHLNLHEQNKLGDFLSIADKLTHSSRQKILPIVIESMQINKADNCGGFLRVVRGIQRVWRGMDPSDC
jgi:hypothetical protein